MTRLSMFLLTALVLAIVAMPVAPLAAQQASARSTSPSLVMTAHNTSAAAAKARGAARPDSSALPGDVLRYAMVFTNTTDGAIRNVKLDNPVPAGLQYVGGSARASRTDAGADFSADGGRTYSAQPMETVVIEGRSVTRPIPAERYTHVRWVIGGTVVPGATVTAEYTARVAESRAAAPVAGSNAPSGR